MLEHTPETGTCKADFTAIYDQPDPRAYYRTLLPLDYQIPQQAMPVLEKIISASTADGRPRPMLDVCCSYGINAALLRYRTDLGELGGHYLSLDESVSPDDVAAADREFLGARADRVDRVVYGLDAAPNAIAYATRAGLLSGGWAEDLENGAPSAELAAGMAEVGLIVCTGGVGYIGPGTFDKLLGLAREPAELWLAVFVLRVFDYGPVADVLSRHGLITERITARTFPQRRFADGEERRAALRDVTERGLDPAGKEADGWFHADCFITRPAAAAASMSLADLLG